MLRTTITRALRTPAAARPFSTSIRALAAGDTGGTRAGGEKASDAFNKREHAQEEFYIRQEERKKLMALKDKLRKQREHLDELDRHIDDLTREQGGEQN